MDISKMKKEVFTFLQDEFVCSLATVDEKCSPSLANMLYLVDEDFTFYVFSKENTEKCKNIAQNESVALSVVDVKKYKTVQVKGHAKFIKDHKTIYIKLEELAVKYKKIHEKIDVPPFFKLDAGDIVLITIKPSWGRFIDFLHHSGDMPYETKGFIG